ncbi:universal stress protein [Halomicrococcus sp. SG-WS-1]|uniref:universal stress protein n=1 Tax=Halomicrococcus sp. SG-WS-1 TaxID=3439057 RepID=UPI003F7B32C6
MAALDASSVDVATEIVRGVPYRAICDYAESTDVDLVVMGTEGQTGLADRLLGSTTDRVIRLCDVPVLVV